MTVKEQQMILDAYDRGEEIEWRSINVAEWSRIPPKDQFKEGGYDEPLFDFIHNYYRVKPKRQRVQRNEVYYCIYSDGSIFMATDTGLEVDGDRFMFGNYFKTEHEAKEAHNLLQKCLLNYHEDNDTKRND